MRTEFSSEDFQDRSFNRINGSLTDQYTYMLSSTQMVVIYTEIEQQADLNKKVRSLFNYFFIIFSFFSNPYSLYLT